MPTTITKTVKPAGGGDYTSLSAAIAGEVVARPDLVTHDEILHLECYGGGSDTTATTINGFTTDPTHYIRIFPAAGQGQHRRLGRHQVQARWHGRQRARHQRQLRPRRAAPNPTHRRERERSSGAAHRLDLSPGAYDIRLINCYFRGVITSTGTIDGFINSNTDDVNGKIFLVNCVSEGFTKGTGFSVRSAPTLQSVYLYPGPIPGPIFVSPCASRDSNAGPSAPEADALSS